VPNYISVEQIADLIRSPCGAQNSLREAIEAILRNEGVIIVYADPPEFDSHGNVTNASQEHPVFRTKNEFLTWLDEKLNSYWIPLKYENRPYAEGPFNQEDAINRRESHIRNGREPGEIFNSPDQESADVSARDYF